MHSPRTEVEIACYYQKGLTAPPTTATTTTTTPPLLLLPLLLTGGDRLRGNARDASLREPAHHGALGHARLRRPLLRRSRTPAPSDTRPITRQLHRGCRAAPGRQPPSPPTAPHAMDFGRTHGISWGQAARPPGCPGPRWQAAVRPCGPCGAACAIWPKAARFRRGPPCTVRPGATDKAVEQTQRA